MPVITADSTFEYTRDWLLSSNTFVEAMGAATANEARARIHQDEVLQEPDEEATEENAPDLPPSINPRPLAVVITEEDERTLVGTGTWSGRGLLVIAIEVLVPEQYRSLHDESQTAEDRSTRFKNRKRWARQLCNTIRLELMEVMGQHGNLNARNVRIKTQPGDPEYQEEQDYIGWEYEVPWVG